MVELFELILEAYFGKLGVMIDDAIMFHVLIDQRLAFLPTRVQVKPFKHSMTQSRI